MKNTPLIMQYRWQVFWGIIIFCLLGIGELGYMAYTAPAPSNSSTFIEVTKVVFLSLGGLGVILPLYINATNVLETQASKKIENTFELLAKWDDSHLLVARKYTRKIKATRSGISDDDLKREINEDEDLKESVMLVANYFEYVRFSILTERIDVEQFKRSLGTVIVDILKRFKPYYDSLGQQHIDDFKQLEDFLK